MKPDRFTAPGLWVETNRDWDGRYWVAWIPHVSRGFSDSKQLLRWVKWPTKTPTGDALRAWIAERLQADEEREKPVPHEGLSPGAKATGFGPETHGDDEVDPVVGTKTII